MKIKRFNEVIGIISSSQASSKELYAIQCDINKVIHYNLFNFMLPHKVKEVVEALTSLFLKMKGLRPQPPKVEEKRAELLKQGREIISNLRPYIQAQYSQDDYIEVYTLQCKRLLALYLKSKKNMDILEAVDLLKKGKALKKEYEHYIDCVEIKAFESMLQELVKHISNNL